MALPRPYSVRFMSGRGPSRYERFTVPEGRRAVVRHCGFLAWATGTSGNFLQVHGVDVLNWAPTGAGSTVRFDCRFTAYERETILAIIGAVDCSYFVDGYLFDDPDGRPDDADNETGPASELQHPQQLPALE